MLPLVAFVPVVLTLQGWKGYEADPRFPYLPSALNFAYRERVLIGYPDDEYMGRGRPRSRYEYAVAVHAIVQTGVRRAEAALATPGDDRERASLLRFGSTIPALTRAGSEFRKELDSLGVEKEFGLAKLNRLMAELRATSPVKDRLFSDVPLDHWAAKDVGDLRALGLLDGYPDGRYRG